jgi:hypothetical protein
MTVALLGSDSLDVCDVNAASLAFGPAGAHPALGATTLDANRDGRQDLIALFRVADTGIALGDDLACLDAQDADGNAFEGCDAISTSLGCGRGFGVALLLPPILWLRRRRA